MKLTTNIRTYIFGGAGHAGIAPISGDAGGEVDTTMSEEQFEEIVLGYLDLEPEGNAEAVTELRADFEVESAELYAEFEEAVATAPTE